MNPRLCKFSKRKERIPEGNGLCPKGGISQVRIDANWTWRAGGGITLRSGMMGSQV
jgi:hypothetical protein